MKLAITLLGLLCVALMPGQVESRCDEIGLKFVNNLASDTQLYFEVQTPHYWCEGKAYDRYFNAVYVARNHIVQAPTMLFDTNNKHGGEYTLEVRIRGGDKLFFRINPADGFEKGTDRIIPIERFSGQNGSNE